MSLHLPTLTRSFTRVGVALGQNLNADIKKVVDDVGRYLILCVATLGFGMLIGLRVESNALAACSGVVISIAFAL